MKFKFYLVIGSNGSTRTMKSKPSLSMDEVAILLNMDVPQILFSKPQLEATISIPEKSVAPKQITVDTVDNIQDAILDSTGVEVKLTIVNEEKTD